MASAQCCEPAQQASSEGQQRHLLGQKVSETASWAFKKEETSHGHLTGESQTKSFSQTQAHSTDGSGAIKSQTKCCSKTQSTGQSGANGVTRTGKNKKKGERKKKGLLEKIRDGISHHFDSSSSSSSSSESDSDDEKREKHGRNKN